MNVSFRLSCADDSCALGDGGGETFGSSDGGGTWAVRGNGAGVTDVSCSSTALCAAVTAAGEVTIFNPTTTVPPLSILTGSLPSGHAGSPYSTEASADGGVPPYQWSATGLPHGVGIDPASGQISGTPVTATCVSSPCPQPPVSYATTLEATDANGTVATMPLSLAISGTDVDLEATTAGGGSGEVSSDPTGIDRCGSPSGRCRASFEDTTTISLTATAAAGSTFAGWSGQGCGGTGTCQIDLTGNAQVTAIFEKVRPVMSAHTLTVRLTGDGEGQVGDPGGTISCPGACSHAYADGSEVALIATSESGSRFLGWSGGGCSGTGACSVNLRADTDLSADFAKTPPQTKITAARISRNGTATFLLKAIDQGGSFECALTGGGKALSRFKGCSSPRTYRHLHAARYVFRVRASGPGGTDPTPAKRAFRIRR